MILVYHSQGISSLYYIKDSVQSIKEVTVIVLVKKVSYNLCICLRLKCISFPHELLFYIQVVFDDPVVDYTDIPFSVVVRVGVFI